MSTFHCKIPLQNTLHYCTGEYCVVKCYNSYQQHYNQTECTSLPIKCSFLKILLVYRLGEKCCVWSHCMLPLIFKCIWCWVSRGNVHPKGRWKDSVWPSSLASNSSSACFLPPLLHPLHSPKSNPPLLKSRRLKQICSWPWTEMHSGTFEYGRRAEASRGGPPRTATTLPLCCANEHLCTNCSFSNPC